MTAEAIVQFVCVCFADEELNWYVNNSLYFVGNNTDFKDIKSAGCAMIKLLHEEKKRE